MFRDAWEKHSENMQRNTFIKSLSTSYTNEHLAAAIISQTTPHTAASPTSYPAAATYPAYPGDIAVNISNVGNVTTLPHYDMSGKQVGVKAEPTDGMKQLRGNVQAYDVLSNI